MTAPVGSTPKTTDLSTQSPEFSATKTPKHPLGARRPVLHAPVRPTHAPGRPGKPAVDKTPPLTSTERKEFKAKLDQVKKIYDSIKSRPDMAYAQGYDPSKADADLKGKSPAAQKKIISAGIMETSRNFRLQEGDTAIANLFDHPLVKINPRMVLDDIDRLLADAKDIKSGKADWRHYQTGFLGAQYLNYCLHQDALTVRVPKPMQKPTDAAKKDAPAAA